VHLIANLPGYSQVFCPSSSTLLSSLLFFSPFSPLVPPHSSLVLCVKSNTAQRVINRRAACDTSPYAQQYIAVEMVMKMLSVIKAERNRSVGLPGVNVRRKEFELSKGRSYREERGSFREVV
jgi:hypothetical protein